MTEPPSTRARRTVDGCRACCGPPAPASCSTRPAPVCLRSCTGARDLGDRVPDPLGLASRPGRTARSTSPAPLTLLAGAWDGTQHAPALRGGPALGAALAADRRRPRGRSDVASRHRRCRRRGPGAGDRAGPRRRRRAAGRARAAPTSARRRTGWTGLVVVLPVPRGRRPSCSTSPGGGAASGTRSGCRSTAQGTWDPRLAARAHRPRRDLAARRRDAGLRQPRTAEVQGRAPRLERRPDLVGGAATGRAGRARRAASCSGRARWCSRRGSPTGRRTCSRSGPTRVSTG